MINIRTGKIEDIPAIANLLVSTWQNSYKGFMPQELLNALSTEKQRRRHLSYMDKGIQYFVAVNEKDTVLGFTSFGSSRNPLMYSDVELYTLYVSLLHQQNGIGGSLVEAVETHIHQQAFTLGVSVFKDNPYQAFYHKIGFQVIGEELMDLGICQVMSQIMRKPLHNLKKAQNLEQTTPLK